MGIKRETTPIIRFVDKVKETVEARRKAYGSPKQNMEDIAALWTVVFRHRFKCPDDCFNATDVTQFMRLVKEARLATTPDHHDSLEDIIGYVDVTDHCIRPEKTNQTRGMGPGARPFRG